MQIYKTTNLITGKIYVGKQKKKTKSYLGSGVHLKSSIKKHGKENFKKEILEEGITDNKILCEREKFWIKELKSQDPKIGYNISNGGDGNEGYKASPETLEKLRKKQLKLWENKEFRDKMEKMWASEEFKKNASESQKGEKGFWYGKKQSDESNEKRRQALLGEKNHMYGKFGKDNPLYGRTPSDQTKKNRRLGILNTIAKKVVQINKDTNEYIKLWNSISEAANNLIGSSGTLHMCCSGRRKTHKGFKWAYYDEEIHGDLSHLMHPIE